MTNKQKELLAKYNRVAEDKSQLQQFAQDLILGEIVEDGIKLYQHIVKVDTDGGDGGIFTVRVISTREEQYETETFYNSLGQNEIISSEVICQNDENYSLIGYLKYDYINEYPRVYVLNQQGDPSSWPARLYSAILYEVISDTVTPLQ